MARSSCQDQHGSRFLQQKLDEVGYAVYCGFLKQTTVDMVSLHSIAHVYDEGRCRSEKKLCCRKSCPDPAKASPDVKQRVYAVRPMRCMGVKGLGFGV